MSKDKIENIKISKLDKSRVEIKASISSNYFESFRKEALQKINNEITIDGFRKGKIPENILISKVGEMAVLEEMAELALSKLYPEIIISEKIDAIGRPEIHITKIASGNPLEFKIITSIIPEINIGNYKNIAKEENEKPKDEIEVTEKEIEDAIIKIKNSHKDHEGHNHDSLESREGIKKYLFEYKKNQAKDKIRIRISDKLIDSSKDEIPDILVDSEMKRIEAQFTEDIKQMGVSIDDYLKHAKKSLEEIKNEWKPHAIKKAKLQLILNKIAQIEKISVEKNKIEEEVEHILKYYKDADRERAYIYAETVLMNEKIFEFLESQK